ncbi:uncharacterized protein LOC116431937 [Nomia melanderi]|uniref:uncharacterized protein LOC116431937 n=1 Tax=Nomia melanderi TaxID=2448451 RepID=UPI00130410E4|nr:uncharacterized protein LOC116431937 [Nomia melanderi]
MASGENEFNSSTDYELLALFDDISALSHLEDNSLEETYLSFLNEVQSDDNTQPAHTSSVQEKVKEQPVHAANGQEEVKDVFAVPKVYTCIYCYKQFYNQMASHMHQVRHAKQQLQCPYCKTRSYNASILRRHFQYFHPYASKQISVRRRLWYTVTFN